MPTLSAADARLLVISCKQICAIALCLIASGITGIFCNSLRFTGVSDALCSDLKILLTVE